MTGSSGLQTEGSRLYGELIAVHTIMRRGAALTATSFARLASGEPVDIKVLVSTARWLTEFVHHHHASEDELFWPVLRKLFPEAVADLDKLTAEHEALDAELRALTTAVDSIAATGIKGEHAPAAAVGHAGLYGMPSSEMVHDILISHLDTEEPVLLDLFPRVPDADIVRLRKAIVDGAPRSGPYFVFGLLEDPERPPGYSDLVQNFPPPVRWLRPLLLNQYRGRKKALGALA
jgi:hemerythrin-like domain-containing protein